MLHILFQDHSPLQPEDKTKLRIKAKKILWIHLDNILDHIQFAGYDNTEIMEQIIKDSIDHLHPHFSGPEIFNEVQTAAITFLLPQPEALQMTFTNIYFHQLISILKTQLKRVEDKK